MCDSNCSKNVWRLISRYIVAIVVNHSASLIQVLASVYKSHQPSLAEASCRIVPYWLLRIIDWPTCLCVSVFVWLSSSSLWLPIHNKMLCCNHVCSRCQVNLHVSATLLQIIFDWLIDWLMAVLPVKNFIYACGLLHARSLGRSLVTGT